MSIKKTTFILGIIATISFISSACRAAEEPLSKEMVRIKRRFSAEERGWEHPKYIENLLNCFKGEPIVIRGSRIDLDDIVTDKNVVILGSVYSEKPWNITCRNFLLLGAIQVGGFNLRATSHGLVAALEEISPENINSFLTLMQKGAFEELAAHPLKMTVFSKFSKEPGTLISTGDININTKGSFVSLGTLTISMDLLKITTGLDFYKDATLRTSRSVSISKKQMICENDEGKLCLKDIQTTISTTLIKILRKSIALSGNSYVCEIGRNLYGYSEYVSALKDIIIRVKGSRKDRCKNEIETVHTTEETIREVAIK